MPSALRQRDKVGYRAKSIRRVADAFLQGQIDELALRDASREKRRKALLDLYGIGPASMWYILFDVYHLWEDLFWKQVYEPVPWLEKLILR